jgi:AraC-like DNA-binding protein
MQHNETKASIGLLWPFEHHPPDSPEVDRAAATYVYDVVKRIWALQHGEMLPLEAGHALTQAFQTLLNGAHVPQAVRVWVSMVKAQQHMLSGEHRMAQRIIEAWITPSGHDATWAPSDLAGAACIQFHGALLQACPPTAEDACLSPFGQNRVVMMASLLEPVKKSLARLGPNRSQCSPKMQSQLHRISAMVAAHGGPKDEMAWFLMAADMALPEPSIGLAYSQLTSAWIFIAKGAHDRAQLALESALNTSRLLGWRLGAWLASYELDCLISPQAPHQQRLSRLRSVWKAADNERAPSPQTHQWQGSRERLAAAIAYVSDNVARRLSIEEIAAQCQVSVRTLSEDFNVGLGMTPLQYVTAQKMLTAKSLIAQGMSLRDVASAVGYESVLGFSKAYLRAMGSAPPDNSG